MHGVCLVGWLGLVNRDWVSSDVGCQVVGEALYRKEIVSVGSDFESELFWVVVRLGFNAILESEFLQLMVIYCQPILLSSLPNSL